MVGAEARNYGDEHTATQNFEGRGRDDIGSRAGARSDCNPDRARADLHCTPQVQRASARANPYSRLLRDTEGNLYGTTLLGGIYNAGAVFKLSRTGKETVLYSFCPGGYPCKRRNTSVRRVGPG